ncbi:MAG: FecR domain-containing protein [Prevotella sp.]|jgi:ferric-dicitrate binding protein FerR (iron transport regulator)
MFDNPHHIDDLILIYLLQEIDEDEQKELNDWIAESEDHRRYFNQQREIWFSALDGGALSKYNVEKAKKIFLQRVEQATASPSISDTTPVVRPVHRLLQWGKMAAAIVIVLGLTAILSYLLGQQDVKSDFTDIAIEVPSGSQTQTTLPDGTRVWLSAESKLTYSQGFGVEDRNVRLQGEGYFEVTHDPQHPFTVKTNELDVQVLGTKFDLTNYPDEPTVKVILDEGRVKLEKAGGGEANYLSPNQTAVMDKKTGIISITEATTKTTRAWRANNLLIENMSFGILAKKLSRIYNVDIRFANPSARNLHFNGCFAVNRQSISEVLSDLAATETFHYTVKGRLITIY